MKRQVKVSGKIAVLQRVLPDYRIPFFDGLAQAYKGEVYVFAGKPTSNESIKVSSDLQTARLRSVKNIYLGYGRLRFCWQQNLISWLYKNKPDVLIMEANPRLLSSYISIWMMKKWGCPIIGWGLGMLDWSASELVLSARKQFLGKFYSSFDAMIAYSTKGASDYQRLGFSSSRIFIAPNAVSNEDSRKLFRKIEQDPQLVYEWKRKLGFSESPVILYVGRLIPEKRVDDLIKACSRLSSNPELVIVGDGPERSALESLASQVLPKTRFLGQRSGEELALCFAASDLFVLPGSGGLAIHEAMIYGKPVIVASGDGTQDDLVRDEKNGFHVTPGDISCLVNIIDNCLKNPTLLNKMGVESRRIVDEEFNMDIMVQSFVKALNFVLEEKSCK